MDTNKQPSYPRAKVLAPIPISRGTKSQTVWSSDTQLWFMSHGSRKWTDLRILVSLSWSTMANISGRNGSHNGHPHILKGKKSFFLHISKPMTIPAIISSLLPMSKSNLAAKQNQQGNYISNFSWNLDSMVTQHLLPLTPWEGNWCPLPMEEVNYPQKP